MKKLFRKLFRYSKGSLFFHRGRFGWAAKEYSSGELLWLCFGRFAIVIDSRFVDGESRLLKILGLEKLSDELAVKEGE